jgi:DNA segregation ATPase FtsK/SpoIIIE-like protein
MHIVLGDEPCEEVQVPSRSTHIDRLLDFRGQSLEGGLFHLLRTWCEGRLVALEHESGDLRGRKLRLQIGKALIAAAGRGQGEFQWPMVNLAERMTLLVVSPRARSSWFEHWGLPLRLIVTGLWVHEGSQLDLVVVRPNHLSKVPGGTGWGAFHPGLSATAARDLCKRLLGDPLAATLHQDRMVDLLYELHPESVPMNQIQTTRVDNADAPVDKSMWHFTLRLQRERDLLLKQAAERDLLLKQAAEREQRAAAREQEVARERAELEQQAARERAELEQQAARERAELEQQAARERAELEQQAARERAELEQQAAELKQQAAEREQQAAEREQQAAEREQQSAEREQQSAEREQRAAAREQEVARERAEVERLERRLLVRLLIVQGKPLAELQGFSLAELRQMAPDQD